MVLAEFKPTPQQQNVFDLLRDEWCHLRVDARAGTGKSTTCREAAFCLDLDNFRTQYLAFNTQIAEDFRKDLPSSCRATTLHSAGFSLLQSSGDVVYEKDKLDAITEKMFPGSRNYDARWAAQKLTSLAKSLLANGESQEELWEIVRAYGVDLPEQQEDEIIESIPYILAECLKQSKLVDFDDMIWLPVQNQIVSRYPPDILFVDEAQDLNSGQHALCDLIAGGIDSHCRTVVVGDPFQAIYAWRGADAYSLETMSGKLERTTSGLYHQPLTVSFRCPTSHIDLVKAIVPDIEAREGAKEGVVEIVKPQEHSTWVRPGDMVLCRTNAPLVSFAYSLIRRDIKAVVRGRNIGSGIISLIVRLRARDLASLMRKAEDYRLNEKIKISQMRNPAPYLEAIDDKVDCLLALCDGAETIEEVKAKTKKVFSDASEDNAVVCSSIHRAKGLERERILIIGTDLLPGPWARTPEDAQQERNLAYVAATRSKNILAFSGNIPSIYAR